MKYMFDIDNTLVYTIGNDYKNSIPIQHRIDRVNNLFDSGNTIYLFTARGMASGKNYYELTKKQMENFGIKHHDLIMNKPDFDVFIDDKAISVNEWDMRQPNMSSPIIWTNGCYDILHIGHIKLFEYCRVLAEACGGIFIIGIDSDSRVNQLKGKNRPFNNQSDRKEILMSIKGVNKVYIFNSSEELSQIIKLLSPQVLVVGDEYKDKYVIGSEYCKSIVYFPKNNKISSTKIISKLKNTL